MPPRKQNGSKCAASNRAIIATASTTMVSTIEASKQPQSTQNQSSALSPPSSQSSEQRLSQQRATNYIESQTTETNHKQRITIIESTTNPTQNQAIVSGSTNHHQSSAGARQCDMGNNITAASSQDKAYGEDAESTLLPGSKVDDEQDDDGASITTRLSGAGIGNDVEMEKNVDEFTAGTGGSRGLNTDVIDDREHQSRGVHLPSSDKCSPMYDTEESDDEERRMVIKKREYAAMIATAKTSAWKASSLLAGESARAESPEDERGESPVSPLDSESGDMTRSKSPMTVSSDNESATSNYDMTGSPVQVSDKIPFFRLSPMIKPTTKSQQIPSPLSLSTLKAKMAEEDAQGLMNMGMKLESLSSEESGDMMSESEEECKESVESKKFIELPSHLTTDGSEEETSEPNHRQQEHQLHKKESKVGRTDTKAKESLSHQKKLLDWKAKQSQNKKRHPIITGDDIETDLSVKEKVRLRKVIEWSIKMAPTYGPPVRAQMSLHNASLLYELYEVKGDKGKYKNCPPAIVLQRSTDRAEVKRILTERKKQVNDKTKIHGRPEGWIEDATEVIDLITPPIESSSESSTITSSSSSSESSSDSSASPSSTSSPTQTHTHTLAQTPTSPTVTTKGVNESPVSKRRTSSPILISRPEYVTALKQTTSSAMIQSKLTTSLKLKRATTSSMKLPILTSPKSNKANTISTPLNEYVAAKPKLTAHLPEQLWKTITRTKERPTRAGNTKTEKIGYYGHSTSINTPTPSMVKAGGKIGAIQANAMRVRSGETEEKIAALKIRVDQGRTIWSDEKIKTIVAALPPSFPTDWPLQKKIEEFKKGVDIQEGESRPMSISPISRLQSSASSDAKTASPLSVIESASSDVEMKSSPEITKSSRKLQRSLSDESLKLPSGAIGNKRIKLTGKHWKWGGTEKHKEAVIKEDRSSQEITHQELQMIQQLVKYDWTNSSGVNQCRRPTRDTIIQTVCVINSEDEPIKYKEIGETLTKMDEVGRHLVNKWRVLPNTEENRNIVIQDCSSRRVWQRGDILQHHGKGYKEVDQNEYDLELLSGQVEIRSPTQFERLGLRRSEENNNDRRRCIMNSIKNKIGRDGRLTRGEVPPRATEPGAKRSPAAERLELAASITELPAALFMYYCDLNDFDYLTGTRLTPSTDEGYVMEREFHTLSAAERSVKLQGVRDEVNAKFIARRSRRVSTVQILQRQTHLQLEKQEVEISTVITREELKILCSYDYKTVKNSISWSVTAAIATVALEELGFRVWDEYEKIAVRICKDKNIRIDIRLLHFEVALVQQFDIKVKGRYISTQGEVRKLVGLKYRDRKQLSTLYILKDLVKSWDALHDSTMELMRLKAAHVRWEYITELQLTTESEQDLSEETRSIIPPWENLLTKLTAMAYGGEGILAGPEDYRQDLLLLDTVWKGKYLSFQADQHFEVALGQISGDERRRKLSDMFTRMKKRTEDEHNKRIVNAVFLPKEFNKSIITSMTTGTEEERKNSLLLSRAQWYKIASIESQMSVIREPSATGKHAISMMTTWKSRRVQRRYHLDEAERGPAAREEKSAIERGAIERAGKERTRNLNAIAQERGFKNFIHQEQYEEMNGKLDDRVTMSRENELLAIKAAEILPLYVNLPPLANKFKAKPDAKRETESKLSQHITDRLSSLGRPSRWFEDAQPSAFAVVRAIGIRQLKNEAIKENNDVESYLYHHGPSKTTLTEDSSNRGASQITSTISEEAQIATERIYADNKDLTNEELFRISRSGLTYLLLHNRYDVRRVCAMENEPTEYDQLSIIFDMRDAWQIETIQLGRTAVGEITEVDDKSRPWYHQVQYYEETTNRISSLKMREMAQLRKIDELGFYRQNEGSLPKQQQILSNEQRRKEMIRIFTNVIIFRWKESSFYHHEDISIFSPPTKKEAIAFKHINMTEAVTEPSASMRVYQGLLRDYEYLRGAIATPMNPELRFNGTNGEEERPQLLDRKRIEIQVITDKLYDQDIDQALAADIDVEKVMNESVAVGNRNSTREELEKQKQRSAMGTVAMTDYPHRALRAKEQQERIVTLGYRSIKLFEGELLRCNRAGLVTSRGTIPMVRGDIHNYRQRAPDVSPMNELAGKVAEELIEGWELSYALVSDYGQLGNNGMGQATVTGIDPELIITRPENLFGEEGRLSVWHKNIGYIRDDLVFNGYPAVLTRLVHDLELIDIISKGNVDGQIPENKWRELVGGLNESDWEERITNMHYRTMQRHYEYLQERVNKLTRGEAGVGIDTAVHTIRQHSYYRGGRKNQTGGFDFTEKQIRELFRQAIDLSAIGQLDKFDKVIIAKITEWAGPSGMDDYEYEVEPAEKGGSAGVMAAMERAQPEWELVSLQRLKKQGFISKDHKLRFETMTSRGGRRVPMSPSNRLLAIEATKGGRLYNNCPPYDYDSQYVADCKLLAANVGNTNSVFGRPSGWIEDRPTLFKYSHATRQRVTIQDKIMKDTEGTTPIDKQEDPRPGFNTSQAKRNQYDCKEDAMIIYQNCLVQENWDIPALLSIEPNMVTVIPSSSASSSSQPMEVDQQEQERKPVMEMGPAPKPTTPEIQVKQRVRDDLEEIVSDELTAIYCSHVLISEKDVDWAHNHKHLLSNDLSKGLLSAAVREFLPSNYDNLVSREKRVTLATVTRLINSTIDDRNLKQMKRELDIHRKLAEEDFKAEIAKLAATKESLGELTSRFAKKYHVTASQMSQQEMKERASPATVQEAYSNAIPCTKEVMAAQTRVSAQATRTSTRPLQTYLTEKEDTERARREGRGSHINPLTGALVRDSEAALAAKMAASGEHNGRGRTAYAELLRQKMRKEGPTCVAVSGYMDSDIDPTRHQGKADRHRHHHHYKSRHHRHHGAIRSKKFKNEGDYLSRDEDERSEDESLGSESPRSIEESSDEYEKDWIDQDSSEQGDEEGEDEKDENDTDMGTSHDVKSSAMASSCHQDQVHPRPIYVTNHIATRPIAIPHHCQTDKRMAANVTREKETPQRAAKYGSRNEQDERMEEWSGSALEQAINPAPILKEDTGDMEDLIKSIPWMEQEIDDDRIARRRRVNMIRIAMPERKGEVLRLRCPTVTMESLSSPMRKSSHDQAYVPSKFVSEKTVRPREAMAWYLDKREGRKSSLIPSASMRTRSPLQEAMRRGEYSTEAIMQLGEVESFIYECALTKGEEEEQWGLLLDGKSKMEWMSELSKNGTYNTNRSYNGEEAKENGSTHMDDADLDVSEEEEELSFILNSPPAYELTDDNPLSTVWERKYTVSPSASAFDKRVSNGMNDDENLDEWVTQLSLHDTPRIGRLTPMEEDGSIDIEIEPSSQTVRDDDIIFTALEPQVEGRIVTLSPSARADIRMMRIRQATRSANNSPTASAASVDRALDNLMVISSNNNAGASSSSSNNGYGNSHGASAASSSSSSGSGNYGSGSAKEDEDLEEFYREELQSKSTNFKPPMERWERGSRLSGQEWLRRFHKWAIITKIDRSDRGEILMWHLDDSQTADELGKMERKYGETKLKFYHRLCRAFLAFSSPSEAELRSLRQKQQLVTIGPAENIRDYLQRYREAFKISNPQTNIHSAHQMEALINSLDSTIRRQSSLWIWKENPAAVSRDEDVGGRIWITSWAVLEQMVRAHYEARSREECRQAREEREFHCQAVQRYAGDKMSETAGERYLGTNSLSIKDRTMRRDEYAAFDTPGLGSMSEIQGKQGSSRTFLANQGASAMMVDYEPASINQEYAKSSYQPERHNRYMNRRTVRQTAVREDDEQARQRKRKEARQSVRMTSLTDRPVKQEAAALSAGNFTHQQLPQYQQPIQLQPQSLLITPQQQQMVVEQLTGHFNQLQHWQLPQNQPLQQQLLQQLPSSQLSQQQLPQQQLTVQQPPPQSNQVQQWQQPQQQQQQQQQPPPQQNYQQQQTYNQQAPLPYQPSYGQRPQQQSRYTRPAPYQSRSGFKPMGPAADQTQYRQSGSTSNFRNSQHSGQPPDLNRSRMLPLQDRQQPTTSGNTSSSSSSLQLDDNGICRECCLRHPSDRCPRLVIGENGDVHKWKGTGAHPKASPFDVATIMQKYGMIGIKVFKSNINKEERGGTMTRYQSRMMHTGLHGQQEVVIDGLVNGCLPCQFLIDTGSHITLAAYEWWDKNQETLGALQPGPEYEVITTTEELVTAVGQIEIDVTLKDVNSKQQYTRPITVIIIQGYKRDVLAGMNFLTKFFSTLNFLDGRMSYRPDLKQDPPKKEGKVNENATAIVIERDVTISPHSWSIIKVRTVDKLSREGGNEKITCTPTPIYNKKQIGLILEFKVLALEDRMEESALDRIETEQGIFKLGVINHSDKLLDLRKGITIGKATQSVPKDASANKSKPQMIARMIKTREKEGTDSNGMGRLQVRVKKTEPIIEPGPWKRIQNGALITCTPVPIHMTDHDEIREYEHRVRKNNPQNIMPSLAHLQQMAEDHVFRLFEHRETPASSHHSGAFGSRIQVQLIPGEHEWKSMVAEERMSDSQFQALVLRAGCDIKELHGPWHRNQGKYLVTTTPVPSSLNCVEITEWIERVKENNPCNIQPHREKVRLMINRFILYAAITRNPRQAMSDESPFRTSPVSTAEEEQIDKEMIVKQMNINIDHAITSSTEPISLDENQMSIRRMEIVDNNSRKKSARPSVTLKPSSKAKMSARESSAAMEEKDSSATKKTGSEEAIVEGVSALPPLTSSWPMADGELPSTSQLIQEESLPAALVSTDTVDEMPKEKGREEILMTPEELTTSESVRERLKDISAFTLGKTAESAASAFINKETEMSTQGVILVPELLNMKLVIDRERKKKSSTRRLKEVIQSNEKEETMSSASTSDAPASPLSMLPLTRAVEMVSQLPLEETALSKTLFPMTTALTTEMEGVAKRTFDPPLFPSVAAVLSEQVTPLPVNKPTTSAASEGGKEEPNGMTTSFKGTDYASIQGRESPRTTARNSKEDITSMLGEFPATEDTVELVFAINPELTLAEIKSIDDMLRPLLGAFAIHPNNNPVRADGVKHEIHLNDTHPIKQVAYRQPFDKQEYVKATIQQLLSRGLIIESNSPWSSPIVLVKKGDSWRMCIDYRKLNHVTKKDAYPIPIIEDCLALCRRADWLTLLDIKDAYWHIEVEEHSQPMTAFVTMGGLFQWKRMPFGLTNGPATFQRYVEATLKKLIGVKCAAFFDDVLIYTEGTLEEHIRDIREIILTLQQAGLEMNIAKCKFAHRRLLFVGHIIEKGKIIPDPAKIAAVKEWPKPKNESQLRSFIGFVNYYHKYIAGFAALSAPLVYLLKKGIKWEWAMMAEFAFHQLKEALCRAPCLYAPDHTKPFILETDASKLGIAAVLAQKYEDGIHPCGYVSRKLNKAEQNYSTTEWEALAMVFGCTKFEPDLNGAIFTIVTDHSPLVWMQTAKMTNTRVARWVMRLQGFTFTVVARAGTANGNADALSRCPLENSAPEEGPEDDVPATTKGEPVAHFVRSDLIYLSPFDPITGKRPPSQQHIPPYGEGKKESEKVIDQELGKQTDQFKMNEQRRVNMAHTRPHHHHKGGMERESEEKAKQAIREGKFDNLEPVTSNGKISEAEGERYQDQSAIFTIVNLSQLDHLVNAQYADPPTITMIEYVKSRFVPAIFTEQQKLRLQQQGENFVLIPQRAGMKPALFYQPARPKGGLIALLPLQPRLVIPPVYRSILIRLFHDMPYGGHMGIKRTARRIQTYYYWDSQLADIITHISNCEPCQKEKIERRRTRAPQGMIADASHPFELVSMDFVGPLQETEEGFKHILVIVCHFTRWIITIATRDQRAETVAACLVDEVFNKYGVPSRLLSDRGASFIGEVIGQLSTAYGIKKLFTSAHHPQTNGMVERVNATIKGMLSALGEEYKQDWSKMLQAATFAFNTAVSEATGYSPYWLLFGRHPTAPGDALALSALDDDVGSGKQSIEPFIQMTLENQRLAHGFTRLNNANKRAKLDNVRSKLSRIYSYSPGDLVWLREDRHDSDVRNGRAGHGTPFKGPYIVCKRLMNQAHTYEIAPSEGRGQHIIVHINRLKPYKSLNKKEKEQAHCPMRIAPDEIGLAETRGTRKRRRKQQLQLETKIRSHHKKLAATSSRASINQAIRDEEGMREEKEVSSPHYFLSPPPAESDSPQMDISPTPAEETESPAASEISSGDEPKVSEQIISRSNSYAKDWDDTQVQDDGDEQSPPHRVRHKRGASPIGSPAPKKRYQPSFAKPLPPLRQVAKATPGTHTMPLREKNDGIVYNQTLAAGLQEWGGGYRR